MPITDKNKRSMENIELKHILIAYKSTNIGLQQAHDEILRQFAVMPSLPTDEDIMRWSKEFNEDDIVEQGRFRTIAKFVRICLQEGNGA